MPGGAGSPGDPRSVLPSLADGDTLCYPWEGELPKGFPHPEQQPPALFPRQNPPEHPQERVRLTPGTMHMWMSEGPRPFQCATDS